MSRYMNIDRTIDDIYDKWGCDPAYIANDTPTGIEARRDAELIEFLQSKPYINIVKCIECEHYCKDRWYKCALHTRSAELDDFCSFGERRKHK